MSSISTVSSRAEILALYGEQERMVKEAERKRITAVSHTTWWRLERKGNAPAKHKNSGGCNLWLLSDLLLWMHGC